MPRPRPRPFQAIERKNHGKINFLKMKRIFNPKPPTELIDGLTAMAKWVEATGARKSKDFERIEIKENLPESWRTNP